MLNDIESDDGYEIQNDDNIYVVTTKVNYSNNKELVLQKIYIDEDGNVKKVEVLDDAGIIKMKMNIDSIDYNYECSDDYFKLENTVSFLSSDVISVSKIDDIIYPMYIPENTYLASQDRFSIDDGERIILTFAGDHPFMLVQETAINENAIISVNGEPIQISNNIGVIDENSITWIDQGIEYYLVSNSLEQSELIDVAKSLTVVAIQK